MSYEDFKLNLEKKVDYPSLEDSNINEFNELYNNSIVVNKFKNLIESIKIDDNEESPEILNTTIDIETKQNSDSDNIFFKKLRSDVINSEEGE